MATEGVIVRVEGEDGEHTDIAIRFAAFDYGSEARSNAAWEKAWQGIGHTGVSIWRLFEPRNPPHRHFIVIIAGETAADVKKTVQRIKGMPGAESYKLPQELMESLAQRRVRKAIEEIRSPAIDGSRRLGMFGSVSRSTEGRDLFRDGIVTTKDKPEERH